MITAGPVTAQNLFLDPDFAATKTSDVIYGVGDVQGGTENLLLDLYEPTGAGVPALKPGVVFIHGGNFTGGDKGETDRARFPEELAKRGYVAVGINYRLFNDNPPLPAGQAFTDLYNTLSTFDSDQGARTQVAALEDAVNAGRWLRDNAASLGMDPNRIAITGDSVGAMTALRIAYLADDYNIPDMPNFQVVVDLWGTFQPFNTNLIESGEMPMLIVHGTSDSLIPYFNATNLSNRAQAVGITVELNTLEGLGHMFSGTDFYNTTEGGVLLMQRTADFMYDAMSLQDIVPMTTPVNNWSVYN